MTEIQFMLPFILCLLLIIESGSLSQRIVNVAVAAGVGDSILLLQDAKSATVRGRSST